MALDMDLDLVYVLSMTSTRSLKAWYQLASADHLVAGLDWYPEAEALASHIAALTGITHRQACGVIAVLSPNCAWPDNKRAALEIAVGYGIGTDPYRYGLPGVYPENVVKAYAIMADPDFGICDGTRPGKRDPRRRVKCGGYPSSCDCPLHGPKVVPFFLAITGDADDGAMDVWATRAARIAPSEIASLAPDDPRREGVPAYGEHKVLTAAYRRAAAAVNVTPRQFQAVVWLVIRDSWIRSDGRVNGRRLDLDLPF